jgi:hypothetical protein
MAVETTATFNLDINEIAEEAFERAGLEMRSGYDLKTARRSLNLMGLEWQNRGLNLWCIEEGYFAFTEGTASYSLPDDTVDIIEAVVRTDPANTTMQIDSSISRVSPVTYATIPDKLEKGRPNQYWVDRQRTAPTIYIYPTASSTFTTAQFVYWRVRRMTDTGTKGSNNYDIPALFLPAMVAGLAYYIAIKKPEAAPRVPMLKQEYEEQFRLAAEENRVKAPFRLIPLAEYYSA